MKTIVHQVFMLLMLLATAGVANAAVSLSEMHTNVDCFGGSNATINITPTGIAPFTYVWNDALLTEDRTNLSAGTYTVTVTDGGATSATLSVTITQPSALLTNTATTPVSCGGGNNGTITLNVAGGTTPYTFLWNDAATTQNRTGVTAANYYVTVTDNKGCIKIDSANVTQPMGMVPSVSVTDANCNASNGQIDLTIQYGYPPYTYVWNDGPTTEDRNSLTIGTYTVTVTDTIACSVTLSATVNQANSPMNINNTATNAKCFGSADGAITITSVVGGVGPFTYEWNDAITTQNRTGLTAGAYSVTVTSSSGCTATKTINITQPTLLTATLTPIAVSCFGSNNGAINTAVAGGNGGNTYNWGIVTTQNRTGLTAGAYTVTVTDSKSCTATANTTVTQPTQLIVAATPTPITCAGGPTGGVTTSVSGGTGSYYYWWGMGITTPNRTNVSSGTYTVTVTDDNGCTATASASILPYTPLSLSATQLSNTCYGANTGSINLTVSNGTIPYLYSWSNTENTEDITNLTANTYTVTVTDNNGCTATKSATITQPSFPITINGVVTDVNCNGENNGTITNTVTNGIVPYNYTWADGPVNQNRTNLIAGNYFLTVTDNAGCTASNSYTVNQPGVITTSSTVVNATCFGANDGRITMIVNGGFAPYNYAWSDAGSGQSRSALPAGNYTVSITDNHSCTTTASAIVAQPAAATVALSTVNATCNGNATGAINTTVTGSGTYTYSWSDGPTTQNRSNIAAGNYTLVVTENNVCNYTATATVNEPAAINITGTLTNVTCSGGNNGAITTSITGGTAPYNYDWGNGIVTPNRSNLTAGTYYLTITDNSACTASTSFIIGQLNTLTVTATATDLLCSYDSTGGSITLNVTGGNGVYTYLWSNNETTPSLSNLSENTYTVTVNDGNGCTATTSAMVSKPQTGIGTSASVTQVTCYGANNGIVNITISGGTAPYTYIWSNNDTTEDLTNLAPGGYYLTITDNNGCIGTKYVTVHEPLQLQGGAAAGNTGCTANNGTVIVSVQGGSTPYNFLWNTNDTTQNLSNLSPGTYTVTITDNKGCSLVRSATVTPGGSLTTVLTATRATCNGAANASITSATSGGSGTYTYNWSNSATGQNIYNLTPGTYRVTISDGNGCSATASKAVTQPAVIQATPSVTHITCGGTNTGAINLTVSGGTAPYQYIWSNGFTTQNISNLNVGSYSVTITDTNSCIKTATATVTQTAPIQVVLNANNVSCNGIADGTITAVTNGGTPYANNVYNYNWSTGATTNSISNLTPTSYLLTVTDAANCQATASASISEPTPIQISETHVDLRCYANPTGYIGLSVTGGTGSYNYNWSNGATTSSINHIAANTYTATVTDANNCIAQKSITVTQPAIYVANETHMNYACADKAGSIDITVTGGTSPYYYNWNDNSTAEDRTNLQGGTYHVTITDYNTCTTTQSVTIQTLAPLTLSVTPTNVTCYGAYNGTINTNVSGGNTPYTYTWTDGVTAANRSNINAGSYAVMVTDASGCSVTDAVSVIQPPVIQLSNTVLSVSCNNRTDGAINLSVTGGAAPYNFLWSNGLTSEDLTNIPAGVYTVTVSDASNCNVTKPDIEVKQPSAIAITADVIPASCTIGNNNGAINLDVTGGNSPYNFAWSNSKTTQNIDQLYTGSYMVTVTDSKGCVAVQNNTVTQAPPLELNFDVKNASCSQVSNGEVHLNVAGGVPSYTYNWSNGTNEPDATQLSAGSYTVTVHDRSNCIIQESFSVSTDYELEVQTSVDNDNITEGETAQLNAATNNNNGNVYTWTPTEKIFCANCATTMVSPVITTEYGVNVVDANGCQAAGKVTINVKPVTDVFIPNVFTPNNDGANDVFKIYGDLGTIRYLDFKIFNRWGEKVYETSDNDFTWDGNYKGEIVPQGVYIYTAKIVYVNHDTVEHKGSITVFR